MIDSSQAYQAAIVGDSRRVLMKLVIDIIDPDLVYSGVETSGHTAISKPEQIYDKVFKLDTPPFATLELDRWALDGTFRIIPEDPADVSQQMGVESEVLSGPDGVFSVPPWVELQFSNVSILQACSVYFSDSKWDGIPEEFTVEVKQGGTSYYTKEVTGNKAASISFTGFTVYDPDAIRVTVKKWSLPFRRARVADILPGVYEEWDGSMLATFDLTQQGNFASTALPYGTCNLKMDNLDRRFEPRNKSGVFQSIEERQGIDVSLGVELPDGSAEFKRLGIYYQYSGGWRTGDNGLTLQWSLVDIVGLLADREFIPPNTLPTTLDGWLAALVAQLGENFSGKYHSDPAYGPLTVTAKDRASVTGKKCGDILRFVCMATGTWPRADSGTGDLTAEPFWSQGSKMTLDNMETYPVMKANADVAAIIFTLSGGGQYIVSGNSTASSNTVSIQNPFLHTEDQALTAARMILATYGGNQLETTGRGDPASEIGDVDTVWLNESTATTGRRQMQAFSFSDGVLQGCKTVLLQADGSFQFQNRAVITASGSWTAPAGVSQLRVILVGQGQDGQDGENGSWSSSGEDGADGSGGKVWAGTININDQQTFDVTIGEDAVFGAYSSANGKNYPLGYTDIASGDSFARTGVLSPLAGSGDGGKGGKGGRKGNRKDVTVTDPTSGETITTTVIQNRPGSGQAGSQGASGCVVVYWNKEVSG